MSKRNGKDEGKSSQGKIIQIDEQQIKGHLDEMVRGTVEEMLNGLLDAEAEQLVGAGRYERSADRQDTRAGHYERSFDMKVGRIKLQMPKLRKLSFETSIIERYKRRESSIEEALIEMYLAGVSVRRVEDITEALWGTRVSPGTVSNLNKKIYGQIDTWRNRPLEGFYPFVYLDGIWLKRSWGGTVENVSVLVAIGVNAEGYREIIGVVEGAKEDKESWKNFLRHLKDRGLKGVHLVISDKCLGLVESLGEFYPDAKWQRCVVHYYRNVFSLVPKGKVKEVVAMLKAIHGQEDHQAAQEKAVQVASRLAPFCSQAGKRRHRRDTLVHVLSPRVLAEDPDEQPPGTDHAGNTASYEGCRVLPRWPLGADVGGCQVAVHSLQQMGKRCLSEHEEAL